MAKTKERTYNIPLRKDTQKVAEWERASKAVKATRKFLVKHMKNEEVKLGKHLNMELHSRGRKHPPHHVKVNVYEEDGKVRAELFGAPEEKVEAPKEEVKKVEEKKEEVKVTEEAKKVEEKKTEEAKEKKEVLEKPVEKKEVKASKVAKDKEADVKQALEDRTTKTEKPKHERKK